MSAINIHTSYAELRTLAKRLYRIERTVLGPAATSSPLMPVLSTLSIPSLAKMHAKTREAERQVDWALRDLDVLCGENSPVARIDQRIFNKRPEIQDLGDTFRAFISDRLNDLICTCDNPPTSSTSDSVCRCGSLAASIDTSLDGFIHKILLIYDASTLPRHSDAVHQHGSQPITSPSSSPSSPAKRPPGPQPRSLLSPSTQAERGNQQHGHLYDYSLLSQRISTLEQSIIGTESLGLSSGLMEHGSPTLGKHHHPLTQPRRYVRSLDSLAERKQALRTLLHAACVTTCIQSSVYATAYWTSLLNQHRRLQQGSLSLPSPAESALSPIGTSSSSLSPRRHGDTSTLPNQNQSTLHEGYNITFPSSLSLTEPLFQLSTHPPSDLDVPAQRFAPVSLPSALSLRPKSSPASSFHQTLSSPLLSNSVPTSKTPQHQRPSSNQLLVIDPFAFSESQGSTLLGEGNGTSTEPTVPPSSVNLSLTIPSIISPPRHQYPSARQPQQPARRPFAVWGLGVIDDRKWRGSDTSQPATSHHHSDSVISQSSHQSLPPESTRPRSSLPHSSSFHGADLASSAGFIRSTSSSQIYRRRDSRANLHTPLHPNHFHQHHPSHAYYHHSEKILGSGMASPGGFHSLGGRSYPTIASPAIPPSLDPQGHMRYRTSDESYGSLAYLYLSPTATHHRPMSEEVLNRSKTYALTSIASLLDTMSRLRRLQSCLERRATLLRMMLRFRCIESRAKRASRKVSSFLLPGEEPVSDTSKPASSSSSSAGSEMPTVAPPLPIQNVTIQFSHDLLTVSLTRRDIPWLTATIRGVNASLVIGDGSARNEATLSIEDVNVKSLSDVHSPPLSPGARGGSSGWMTDPGRTSNNKQATETTLLAKFIPANRIGSVDRPFLSVQLEWMELLFEDDRIIDRASLGHSSTHAYPLVNLPESVRKAYLPYTFYYAPEGDLIAQSHPLTNASIPVCDSTASDAPHASLGFVAGSCRVLLENRAIQALRSAGSLSWVPLTFSSTSTLLNRSALSAPARPRRYSSYSSPPLPSTTHSIASATFSTFSQNLPSQSIASGVAGRFEIDPSTANAAAGLSQAPSATTLRAGADSVPAASVPSATSTSSSPLTVKSPRRSKAGPNGFTVVPHLEIVLHPMAVRASSDLISGLIEFITVEKAEKQSRKQHSRYRRGFLARAALNSDILEVIPGDDVLGHASAYRAGVAGPTSTHSFGLPSSTSVRISPKGTAKEVSLRDPSVDAAEEGAEEEGEKKKKSKSLFSRLFGSKDKKEKEDKKKGMQNDDGQQNPVGGAKKLSSSANVNENSRDTTTTTGPGQLQGQGPSRSIGGVSNRQPGTNQSRGALSSTSVVSTTPMTSSLSSSPSSSSSATSPQLVSSSLSSSSSSSSSSSTTSVPGTQILNVSVGDDLDDTSPAAPLPANDAFGDEIDLYGPLLLPMKPAEPLNISQRELTKRRQKAVQKAIRSAHAVSSTVLGAVPLMYDAAASDSSGGNTAANLAVSRLIDVFINQNWFKYLDRSSQDSFEHPHQPMTTVVPMTTNGNESSTQTLQKGAQSSSVFSVLDLLVLHDYESPQLLPHALLATLSPRVSLEAFIGYLGAVNSFVPLELELLVFATLTVPACSVSSHACLRDRGLIYNNGTVYPAEADTLVGWSARSLMLAPLTHQLTLPPLVQNASLSSPTFIPNVRLHSLLPPYPLPSPGHNTPWSQLCAEPPLPLEEKLDPFSRVFHFKFIRIAPTEVLVTYFGKGDGRKTASGTKISSSIEDVEDLHVALRGIVFRQKQWNILKLLRVVRNALVFSLLSQLGGSLRQFFAYKLGLKSSITITTSTTPSSTTVAVVPTSTTSPLPTSPAPTASPMRRESVTSNDGTEGKGTATTTPPSLSHVLSPVTGMPHIQDTPLRPSFVTSPPRPVPSPFAPRVSMSSPSSQAENKPSGQLDGHASMSPRRGSVGPGLTSGISHPKTQTPPSTSSPLPPPPRPKRPSD